MPLAENPHIRNLVRPGQPFVMLIELAAAMHTAVILALGDANRMLSA
jgi:hypothetical protein